MEFRSLSLDNTKTVVIISFSFNFIPPTFNYSRKFKYFEETNMTTFFIPEEVILAEERTTEEERNHIMEARRRAAKKKMRKMQVGGGKAFKINKK